MIRRRPCLRIICSGCVCSAFGCRLRCSVVQEARAERTRTSTQIRSWWTLGTKRILPDRSSDSANDCRNTRITVTKNPRQPQSYIRIPTTGSLGLASPLTQNVMSANICLGTTHGAQRTRATSSEMPPSPWERWAGEARLSGPLVVRHMSRQESWV